jgi:hypothetical protein
MKQILLEVGYDKNGEMDFGISAVVGSLTRGQMKDFREMIMVAIGIAEDMWRSEQMKKECAKTSTVQR